jgi:FkbM family methyltransferase
MYCLLQGSLHKNFFNEFFNKILFSFSPSISCKWFNIRQYCCRHKVFYYYDNNCDLYFAKEGEKRIHYFSEKTGFFLYQFGLKERGMDIAASYYINGIEFNEDDVVLDCGANSADLYLYFSDYYPFIKYESFEPSPREFNCVQKNALDGVNNNVGLNEKTGKFEFYVSSIGSDSSFIKPKSSYTDIIEINSITLDDYIASRNFKTIKLLKLEAEGLEPEILKGGSNSLSKIQYLAIDGGAERGVRADTTIEFASNFLIANGFEMTSLAVISAQGRALFKNKNIKN